MHLLHADMPSSLGHSSAIGRPAQRSSSFSHKAPAQAAASTKGMPPIANTLRTISAMPPRMRCALALPASQGAAPAPGEAPRGSPKFKRGSPKFLAHPALSGHQRSKGHLLATFHCKQAAQRSAAARPRGRAPQGAQGRLAAGRASQRCGSQAGMQVAKARLQGAKRKAKECS